MKWIEELVRLDESKLLKLAVVAAFIISTLAPGAIVLMFVGLPAWSTIGIWHLLGLCLAISVPFVVLGFVTYVHPLATMEGYLGKTPRAALYSTMIGAALWATLDSIIISVVVFTAKKELAARISDDVRVQYGAVIIAAFAIFGLLTFINAGRFLRIHGGKKG